MTVDETTKNIDNGPEVGVIVGSVVGGIVGLALISGIGIFIYLKKIKVHPKKIDTEMKRV